MKLKLPNRIIQYTLLVLTITSTTATQAQNLLTNGDFESGGSTVGFFVHDYTLISPLNGISTPGTYARTTSPALMNTTFLPSTDHTTGTGNMIVIDGAAQANKFFWTTGNTGGAIGGFNAGTTYTFSYWIKSVSNDVTAVPTTRANIGAFFVNASNINPANLNTLAPLPASGWQQVSYSFVATANNVLIRLKTNTPGAIGNDFAIDDFSITQGSLPFAGTFTSVNPTCPTNTDGAITVSLTGGTLPYAAYVLSGTVNQSNNTGIFTNLPQGTYAITATDAAGQQYAQANIILLAPNNLQLSNSVTICNGDTTTLTATGGNNTYTWTANPTDASLTNPNAATQNLSPSVTTTYTVTSGQASSTANLVANGDFSQGNTAFTTEYSQVANPNPFGVQASYDIVTNPNAWFTAFASCGDHTTGTGNMMVVDGSTDPTGTIKVWCNATPIAVTPNKNYTFSYYVASVAVDNPAKLEVTINGVSQGLPVTAPPTTCQWTQVSYVWNSGSNTTADICIYDREFIDYGNDFALDDITLVETITCLYQQSVTVTVNPLIIPTFNPIPDSCFNTTINPLPTTSNNGITGIWAPALNNQSTTTYTFTPAPAQCADTTTTTIIVKPLPVVTLSQGCNGNSYTLTATPATSTDTTTFEWFNPSNSSISTQSSVAVTTPGTYTVLVTQDNCSTPGSIIVNSPYCTIPKGISPNNDGYNDNLDLTAYNVSNLKIFNRYGTIAYDKSSYQDQWYGQANNGNELPDGTYYYVIDFSNLPTKTGWIYINRVN